MKGPIVGTAMDDPPPENFKAAVDEYIKRCQARRQVPQIIIDMGQVTYINSTSIAMLVQTYSAIRQHSGRMVVAGICETVKRVFESTKLSQVFEVAESLEKAKALLQV